MLSRAYAPIISLPAARGRLVTYSLFTRWTRCEIRSAEVAVEEKPRQKQRRRESAFPLAATQEETS